MPANENNRDDTEQSGSSPQDEQTPGIEPEITEPGFHPLDDTNPDDDDMTLQEPPKVIDDEVPPLLRDEPVAIARSPKPGHSDTIEEPPQRFLTSDPPPAPPGASPVKPGVETRPMSPVPPTSEQRQPGNDLSLKLPNSRPRNPVLVPSPNRMFANASESESSWSEGDPMRPSDFPPKDRLNSEERQKSPSEVPLVSPVSSSTTPPPPEPPPKGRSIPVALLATCMFVVGFVGTGAFIWWYADHDSNDEAVGNAADTAQNDASNTAPPAQKQVAGGNPIGIQSHPQSPETTHNTGGGTKAPIPPSEAIHSAETLIQLGDDEVERIRSATDVRRAEDFDQALTIPRAHYDSAQEYYEQAIRYDPNQLQCIEVRMAAAAERLASVYLSMAESSQVQAIDAARFPQELRDTAANYRSVARRHYHAARGAHPVQPECESLATAGERRTSAALGLGSTP